MFLVLCRLMIVSRYNFDTMIGDHLTRLGTEQDLDIQKEFITDLVNASKTANGKINFMDYVSEYRLANPWLIVSESAYTVTDECTNIIIGKWKDKLRGAEKFTETCYRTMTKSWRVD